MFASIFKALWEVLADVFVELLDREDFVDEEVEPVLETLDPVGVDDLFDRYGGLLDED